MKSLSESEQAVAPLFDRALMLRDRGEFDAACEVLEQLLTQLDGGPLAAHSHNQCGYMRKQQGRLTEAETHFRKATEMHPRFELGSLSLFHILLRRGCELEAFAEALRFVSLRESLGYRELFEGDAFRGGLGENEAKLAAAVRAALAAHREMQALKPHPERGDTVNIHPKAPLPLRPGAFGCVKEVRGTSFILMFADGETQEVPSNLVVQLSALGSGQDRP